ncbi:hypothetical protein L1987_50684 [Smallanthus sonchifolius]|uniref:Uncharacterized protein n=1 Tax=Smallanthus sonchifolius TaxID=185202 RepID=A0ACB9ENJ7_9ASTR|nr:hypothetical protein L1987_50684 [Smallanthus sonchifolius]
MKSNALASSFVFLHNLLPPHPDRQTLLGFVSLHREEWSFSCGFAGGVDAIPLCLGQEYFPSSAQGSSLQALPSRLSLQLN